NGLVIQTQALLEAQEENLRMEGVAVGIPFGFGGFKPFPGEPRSSGLGPRVVLVFGERPLFFFGVSGAVLLSVAAILAIFVLETLIRSGNVAQGTASLVVLFGTVGFVSIFIGLTLNALKRFASK